MKKVFSIAAGLAWFSLVSLFGQSSPVKLTFTATSSGHHVDIDSIHAENLTKSVSLIMYGADTVLTLGSMTGIPDNNKPDPMHFMLYRNMPNPFSHETRFRVYVPFCDQVDIAIYDLQGKRIASFRDRLPAGDHWFRFVTGKERCMIVHATWRQSSATLKMIRMNDAAGFTAKLAYDGMGRTGSPGLITGPDHLTSSLSMTGMPEAITLVPANATAYDLLTLTFDPAQACFQSGSLSGLPSVALHSGVKLITGEIWQNVVEFNQTGANGQGTMLLPTGDGRYYITYTPSKFYGFSGQTVTAICAVFNNGNDWSQDGRDFSQGGTGCVDFFIPLRAFLPFDPGDQLRFTCYAKSYSGLNGSDVITDAPLQSKTYTFDIEEGSNQPPVSPSSLTATAVSSVKINLTWNDNSDNEAGFRIERSPDGTSGWSEIHTTSANETSYSDIGLSPSTTYFYRVRAFNEFGNSAYSAPAHATTSSDLYSPPTLSAPASSTGTFTVSISYSWGTFGTNLDYYELEESTTSPTSGFASIHQSVAGTHTSPYNIELTRSGGTYYYRARVYRGYPAPGFSSYSIVASVVVTVPARSVTLINDCLSSNYLNEVVQVKIARYENQVYVRPDLLTDDPAQCLPFIGESIPYGGSRSFDISIGANYSIFIGMGRWEAIFPPVGCSTTSPWSKITMFTEALPPYNYVWVWITVNVTDAPSGNWNWTISGNYLNNTLKVTPAGFPALTFNRTYYNPIP